MVKVHRTLGTLDISYRIWDYFWFADAVDNCGPKHASSFALQSAVGVPATALDRIFLVFRFIFYYNHSYYYMGEAVYRDDLSIWRLVFFWQGLQLFSILLRNTIWVIKTPYNNLLNASTAARDYQVGTAAWDTTNWRQRGIPSWDGSEGYLVRTAAWDLLWFLIVGFVRASVRRGR